MAFIVPSSASCLGTFHSSKTPYIPASGRPVGAWVGRGTLGHASLGPDAQRKGQAFWALWGDRAQGHRPIAIVTRPTRSSKRACTSRPPNFFSPCGRTPHKQTSKQGTCPTRISWRQHAPSASHASGTTQRQIGIGKRAQKPAAKSKRPDGNWPRSSNRWTRPSTNLLDRNQKHSSRLRSHPQSTGYLHLSHHRGKGALCGSGFRPFLGMEHWPSHMNQSRPYPTP